MHVEILIQCLLMCRRLKFLSFFVLVLFCSGSFLNLSKSLYHSLDSFSTELHFHTSEEVDHHGSSENSHSDEENETMVRLDPDCIKNTSHSLNLTLIILATPHTKQLYNQSKDYIGKLSGVDPPINRLDFRSLYPNAPPSFA
jgi:hypothetical protein